MIFFTKSKLTVRVPVRKAANIGMRRPSDISSVQEAKQILSETPRKGRGNWSRLALEYEGKIKSGDIVAVAFKQQEPPGSDALMATAGLLPVIVEMGKPVDGAAQEPDSMALPFCEGI